ncbi:MAG TPA: HNH endonuclease signature motif containing protein [Sphingobium sp.]|uniref:HNH endonuclease signature motif containing protein n=1 Tax=Sphingobium sp. TaxID=1912891 RepID=UPI002ED6637E
MGRLKAFGSRVGSAAPKLKAAPKVAEGFYSTPQWRGLVKDIKRMRGNRCERAGCTTPTHRVIADHIIERKDGGADLDERNVELLCFTHHARKTAEAKARRARGEVA